MLNYKLHKYELRLFKKKLPILIDFESNFRKSGIISSINNFLQKNIIIKQVKNKYDIYII